jgi:hypothetical protein
MPSATGSGTHHASIRGRQRSASVNPVDDAASQPSSTAQPRDPDEPPLRGHPSRPIAANQFDHATDRKPGCDLRHLPLHLIHDLREAPDVARAARVKPGVHTVAEDVACVRKDGDSPANTK